VAWKRGAFQDLWQRALAKWREYISNLRLISFYEKHAQIVLSMKNMKDKIKKQA
jgi:hypothetical protein